MRQYFEVPTPTIGDYWLQKSVESYLPVDLYGEYFSLMGSGKSALSVVLDYLLSTGVFPDKTYEIIVPSWLGTWVYGEMQQHVFPARQLSQKTRAILVYHQYGYPQDMDRILEYAEENNLVVIEDCAHCLNSEYKGIPVGTFGEFSIFSFSKFFFCYALGGLIWKNDNFVSFLEEKVSSSSRLTLTWINLTKLLYDNSRILGWPYAQKVSSTMMLMAYALYGRSHRFSKKAEKLFYLKLENEIRIRKDRYEHTLNFFADKGVINHLEQSGVTPYVIPIELPVKTHGPIIEELAAYGFKTGIYHFDMNRFLLEPDFKPCLWVYCHSKIMDSEFEMQLQIIKKHL